MRVDPELLEDIEWPGEEAARPWPWPAAAFGFGLSLALHVAVFCAFLFYGALAFSLSGGGPGPLNGYLAVGLYGAPPGDPEGGDGQEAGESRADEGEAPGDNDAPAEAPLFDPPDFEVPASEPVTLERLAPPPEPDPEAIALIKEAEKKEPPRKRSSRPAKTAAVKKAPAPEPPIGRQGGPGAGQALFGSGAGQGPGKNAGKPGGGGGAGGGGGGGGGGAALKSYLNANFSYITRHIRRKMVYPEEAKRQGVTGTAAVAFTINRSGQASNIRITRSSGSQLLDQAALSAVQRAAPFPPPPAPANVSIPLRFGLR
ncbi:MAG: energy transducer TonB [Candidatus Adiutrix sp.]|jgi:protein TonB|nr:energy transducer TonB [Candidatus Adiutrix sp.]